jgi:hypothetical protein
MSKDLTLEFMQEFKDGLSRITVGMINLENLVKCNGAAQDCREVLGRIASDATSFAKDIDVFLEEFGNSVVDLNTSSFDGDSI